jgi:hypothetical protein
MRLPFEAHSFSPASRVLIAHANEIVADLHARGFTLTLRQLYYQLVSRNVIPNRARAYKNLSAVVNDARWAGTMDVDALEDRLRRPVTPTDFENLNELVKAALASYRLPRWRGQSVYVEVWCEKDALSSVLEPVAQEFHITFMSNRGYSSFSAMHEAAQRLQTAAQEDKAVQILYLGDHDPSGKDMVRDIASRLRRFNCDLDVRALALTKPQVLQYRLPPQPAKDTDARYDAYAAEHGTDVWELDALPPDALVGLVRSALAALVDRPALQAVLTQERRDKQRLQAAVKSLGA